MSINRNSAILSTCLHASKNSVSPSLLMRVLKALKILALLLVLGFPFYGFKIKAQPIMVLSIFILAYLIFREKMKLKDGLAVLREYVNEVEPNESFM